MQNELGASHVIEMMEFSQDKEVQANCAKIIRLCLRDDMVSAFYTLLMNYLVLRTNDDVVLRAGKPLA